MIYRGVEIVQAYRSVNVDVYALHWVINEGDGPDEKSFDTLEEAQDWVDEHA